MAVKESYHGHRKRLRHKFESASLEGFHDYEVVELLLTFAIPRIDVKPQAKALIKTFGGVGGVLDAPPGELGTVKGVGENTAMFLTMIKDVARVYLRDRRGWKKNINNAEDALDFLSGNFSETVDEGLIALYLDTKNYVLEAEVLHEGDLRDGDVSARRVIKGALAHNARSVIFVHKTCGVRAGEGSPERALAVELEESISAIDIIVHDYLVIGKDFIMSAKAEGWFEKGRGGGG
ncbi:MAG: DNA repair protein RadC [Thermodesulfobacteriota bacterium]|nr:MAG: DNA repair protein RadC [Thermodesulfobacteriota bacterium]